MDRRGFGKSGDAGSYALEREFADVAAVADAAADRSGAPVAVFGHSFGANPAMGSATRSRNVARLVLYEPSLGLRYPVGSIDAIERQIDAGDVESAMRTILVDIAGMNEREVEGLRRSPSWPARLASAPTIVRECRVEDGWVYPPGMFDGVSVVALLLTGSDSPPELVDATRAAAAALPRAEVKVLEGHGHFAYRTDPTLVAAIMREFLGAS
jgi:pimeloyl-ACP methyl ester carboxylesterase